MSQFEEALASRLTGFTGLTNLVSNRIYPVVLPENPTYPAVTYQRISAVRASAMSTDTGLVQTRVQVSIWSTLYSEAKSVKEQVRAALQRWRGTVLGLVIEDTFIENETDLYQPEIPVYHLPVDATVHYVEV
jgi:hypothetical protein